MTHQFFLAPLLRDRAGDAVRSLQHHDVDPQVHREGRAVAEGLSAIAALVWFLPGVDPLVLSERGALYKTSGQMWQRYDFSPKWVLKWRITAEQSLKALPQSPHL